MPSATIKMFLVHGDPKRLRTAELSGWTGKAVAGPRSDFDGVLKREEASKAGVYFPTGVDAESGKLAIYVGEAEVIRDRVKAHLAKDFWNQFVFFASKDDNLTKAHVRYLEGRLIEDAWRSGRAAVMNGVSSGARLPESDSADMEVFLEKVNQLLPVLSVDLVIPTAVTAAGAHEQLGLYCDINGLRAEARLSPTGLLVLSGSRAALQEHGATDKYPWAKSMRDRLKEEGALAVRPDCLQFVRDVEFTSASAAAAVIHGGNTNGLTAWRDERGRTLK